MLVLCQKLHIGMYDRQHFSVTPFPLLETTPPSKVKVTELLLVKT